MPPSTFEDTPQDTVISFNEIPTSLRVPLMMVEFDNSNAVSGASSFAFRNLVIGQRLATGTVAALEPVRLTNASQATGYFGAGSMLEAMMTAHFENNAVNETWVVALDDDAAGQAAAGSVAFGGAVAAGTLFAMIAGIPVRVGVAAADTLTDIAAAFAAAVTAKTSLPVTAAVNGVDDTIVDLTARHKGEAGNDIDIRFNYYAGETTPSGLTVTITAMAGGTANPDISDVWAELGEEHYNVITCPYTDAANLTALEAELADRFGPLRMTEAMAFTAATGTHSELGTLGDSRNSPHLSIMNAHAIPTHAYVFAAGVAATASYHGNIDPARPFQTLAVKGILPPAHKDRFTTLENNLLLFDGISTFSVDSGGLVRIQRLITTYKTSSNGADDISYLDVNTLMTLGYLRYDFRNYIMRKYPRHKLADDGGRYGPGQAIMTPKTGRAEAIARFRVWESLGLVENIDQFKNDLLCVRNPGDPNRLDWRLPPDLINQFRIGAAQIQFLL